MTRKAALPLEDTAETLHSVAIHLLRRLRTVDADMGLSAPRASALSVLVFGGPCSLAQLASKEQVTSPSMIRIVAALEQAGLVTREPDVDDLRSIRISATAQGRKLLRQGRARRIARLSELLETLTSDERQALATATTALKRALGQAP